MAYCIFLRSTLLARSLRMGSSRGSSGRGAGFMPKNTSSSSINRSYSRRASHPLVYFCMMVAIWSLVFVAAKMLTLSSKSLLYSSAMRSSSMRFASASSADSGGGANTSRVRYSGTGLVQLTLPTKTLGLPSSGFVVSNLWIRASRNLARAPSSCRLSSTKYLGTGISIALYGRFMSCSTSSNDTWSNSRANFFMTQCLSSRHRPMVASRAFLTSTRFCGWLIWSYARSSLRKIWTYRTYPRTHSVGSRSGSVGGSSSPVSSSYSGPGGGGWSGVGTPSASTTGSGGGCSHSSMYARSLMHRRQSASYELSTRSEGEGDGGQRPGAHFGFRARGIEPLRARALRWRAGFGWSIGGAEVWTHAFDMARGLVYLQPRRLLAPLNAGRSRAGSLCRY